MRIGIITFHAANNYGAVLQAYALQTYLQGIGHDPYFIDYQYCWDIPIQKGLRGWFSRSAYGTAKKINSRLLRRVFSDFRERYLCIDSHQYSGIQQLQTTPPVADVYMCGSDQIWNPDFIREDDEESVWLSFGNGAVRRVAYAASFGRSELYNHVCSRWSNYARDLDSISVRERTGICLMKKLGRSDVTWVPDPTLLLHNSDYVSLEPVFSPRDKFLFSYCLETDDYILQTTVKTTVQRVLGLACYEIKPYALCNNVLNRCCIAPGQWLSRLRRSAFVVTNSFHGLVFSLLFRRPFIVLLRRIEGLEMSDRIISLLEVAGLKHRLLTICDEDQMGHLCSDTVDWDRVEDRIADFREVGCRFIRDALS